MYQHRFLKLLAKKSSVPSTGQCRNVSNASDPTAPKLDLWQSHKEADLCQPRPAGDGGRWYGGGRRTGDVNVRRRVRPVSLRSLVAPRPRRKRAPHCSRFVQLKGGLQCTRRAARPHRALTAGVRTCAARSRAGLPWAGLAYARSGGDIKMTVSPLTNRKGTVRFCVCGRGGRREGRWR